MLAKDRLNLTKTESQLEFKFDFKIEDYIFVACMMLKYDSNLMETRENLVPTVVTEDEFWRNYFYTIESIKKDMGLPTRLAGRINDEERGERIKLEDEKLNEARQ